MWRQIIPAGDALAGPHWLCHSLHVVPCRSLLGPRYGAPEVQLSPPQRQLHSIQGLIVSHVGVATLRLKPPTAPFAWRGRGGVVSQRACPTPAARSVPSSTPRPAQHAASVPLITTAGSVRMPKRLARRATSGLCMSSTVTSQDGQETRFTRVTVSSHAGQPALKISIVRL